MTRGVAHHYGARLQLEQRVIRRLRKKGPMTVRELEHDTLIPKEDLWELIAEHDAFDVFTRRLPQGGRRYKVVYLANEQFPLDQHGRRIEG